MAVMAESPPSGMYELLSTVSLARALSLHVGASSFAVLDMLAIGVCSTDGMDDSVAARVCAARVDDNNDVTCEEGASTVTSIGTASSKPLTRWPLFSVGASSS